MTIIKPNIITIYFLNFDFLFQNNAIIDNTNIEHVILDDIAYNIASNTVPPLKFGAIVICLSTASKMPNIGYKYPGIIQKIMIIAETAEIKIVLFICFLCKNSRKI